MPDWQPRNPNHNRSAPCSRGSISRVSAHLPRTRLTEPRLHELLAIFAASTAAATTRAQCRLQQNGAQNDQHCARRRTPRRILPWRRGTRLFSRSGTGMLDAGRLRVCCSQLCCVCAALPALAQQTFPAVNPESKKSQAHKTKTLKLRDLAPQKDTKGGAGKTSAPSDDSPSTVPTSLEEFLKSDSLPIKR